MDYSYSKFLFEEIKDCPEEESFFRKKLWYSCEFIKKFFKFPFCILSKITRTLFRILSLALYLFLSASTLGLIKEFRTKLYCKAKLLAEDLTDWFLYPFALFANTIRAFFKIFLS